MFDTVNFLTIAWILALRLCVELVGCTLLAYIAYRIKLADVRKSDGRIKFQDD